MNRYDTTLPLYGAKKENKFKGIGIRDSFQISSQMVVASIVFWLCMSVATFKAVEYGLLYRTLHDENFDRVDCCTNFGGTNEDRMNFVEGYEKGDAGPYLSRLGPESFHVEFKGTPSPAELQQIPPIVTAVTSADFYDLQGLIKQVNEELKPALGDVKLIVYDLGLYESELKLLQAHCKCDVRVFDPSTYPVHVTDIQNYAWRPIILQTVIEEHGSVLYVDPSTRFPRASDLNQLKYRGERHFFLWDQPTFNGLVAYTNPLTFAYLKEKGCCYRESGLIDTAAMVFYRTDITWKAIMKPWLKCALNKECISPPKSRYSGCFHMRKPLTTGCHRYDQSVLSIIMERMFQFTLKSDKLMIPRIVREREEYVEYFPEQPWSYTELFFVSAMPLTCLGGLIFLFRRRRRRRPAPKKR